MFFLQKQKKKRSKADLKTEGKNLALWRKSGLE